MPIPNSSPDRAEDVAIRRALLAWYRARKRDLPWRNTRDPYSIWVSEIMLQQTRVNAVLDHYARFLREFPNVQALADASLEQVLAAWSGLGYYRRAKALHEAAKAVVSQHNGRVPETREGLLQLPGIGRYTSAAIASIAFGVPHAVVDGNVERVLSRLDGKTYAANEYWTRADELLHPKHAGDWNQAMMELGATVCLPLSPVCPECPIRKHCKTPGRDLRREKETRNKRQLSYGLASRPTSVYLVQRDKTESIMPLMWELPTVVPNRGECLLKTKHSITSTDYDVYVYPLSPRAAKGGKWIELSQLASIPLTGLARKILKRTHALGSR